MFQRRVTAGQWLGHGRRGRRLGAAVAVVTVAVLVSSGCGASSPSATTGVEGSESAEAVEALGHVHGLGIDPGTDEVFAASHFGVFRLAEDGSAQRVADRWQDTMAFTVVGPGHFLGSGHPDLREDLPSHLGLIESTDGAETWSEVSLQGEADFHALEATEDGLYGFDSVSGRLMSSVDGREWEPIDRADALDLAASPDDPTLLLVTNQARELVSYDTSRAEAAPRRLETAPPLTFIDWPEPDLLVGLGGDGALHRSRDGGSSWRRVHGPPGEPQALEVSTGRWLVATSAGIFASADEGRTWRDLAGGGA